MKSVLTSIQPYYVFLIIAEHMGWEIPQKKTIEVRKNFPKACDWDNKVYIYCSKNKKLFNRIPKEYQPLMEPLLGKVIGGFYCDKITKYPYEAFNDGEHFMPYGELEKTGLDGLQLYDYLGVEDGYGWEISNLEIYDKPIDLHWFFNEQYQKITMPPQSWMYVNDWKKDKQ